MSVAVSCNPSEAKFLALASDGKLTEMQQLYGAGKVNINCCDEKGDHALLKATRVGSKAVVSWLLLQRCNVNQTSKVGSSALLAAGMQGHADIAALLLQSGANLNQRTDGLDSAVSLAIWKNHSEVALLLIGAGANVDTQDKFGDCPLHDSAKHGNVKVMAPLIQRIPHRISARNAKGQTPLHCAAMHGHGDAVRLLLAHSADPTIVDDEKKSPYDHASGEEVAKLLAPNHLKQIAEVLQEMKLKFEDKSDVAAGDNTPPQFRFLLTKAAPIELQEFKIQISRKSTLVVYSSCKARVPAARRSAAAEMVSRINFDLPTGGNFELDMRDGEVRYKSSFGFGSGKVADLKDMTRYFVQEHTAIYESYCLAVLELVKQPNATPKELYLAFRKKHGL